MLDDTDDDFTREKRDCIAMFEACMPGVARCLKKEKNYNRNVPCSVITDMTRKPQTNRKKGGARV